MARTPEPNMIDPRIRLMARPPHPPHPPHAESSAPHPPRSLSSALQKARKITAAGVIRKPKRKKNKLAAPLYKPSGRKACATEKGPAIGKGLPGRVAKAKRRWKPGSMFPSFVVDIARALREIKHYQKTTGLCLSQLPFQRVVREISEQFSSSIRYQRTALLALQEASEHILTTYFELMYLAFGITVNHRNKLAIHAKRVTILPRDHVILRELWAVLDPNSAIGSHVSDQKTTSDQAAKRKQDQRVRDNESIHTQIRAHKDRGEKAIVKQGMIKGWRPIVEEDSSEDEDTLEARYPTDPDNLKGYYSLRKIPPAAN